MNTFEKNYGKLIYKIMFNLHESGYLSPKSLTYVAETLGDMDIDFDYDELESIFNKYLDKIALGLEEAKKKKKDRIHINKNAGDVPYNIGMFNKGFANAGPAASGSEACGMCESIYSKSELLEGSATTYLKKGGAVTSDTLLRKVLSTDLFPILVLDDSLNKPTVINKGGHGNSRVNPAVEEDSSKVFPKPGFSIYSNAWSQKDPSVNTHNVTHHVFGYKASNSGDAKGLQKITVPLPIDWHTLLHNNIFKSLKKTIKNTTSQNKSYSDIYSDYRDGIDDIRAGIQQNCVYDNQTGLFLRELEYALRELGLWMQSSSALSLARLQACSEQLAELVGQSPAVVLNQNNSSLLKVRTKSGKEFKALPIILATDASLDDSDTAAFRSTADKWKLIETNGTYLTRASFKANDIDVNLLEILVLINDVKEAKDSDILVIKNDIQWKNFIQDIEETKVEETEEEQKDIVTESLNEDVEDELGEDYYVTPVLISQVLENDIYDALRDKGTETGYNGIRGKMPGSYFIDSTSFAELDNLFKKIGKYLEKNNPYTSRVTELNFKKLVKKEIRDFLHDFFNKHNYQIFLNRESKAIEQLERYPSSVAIPKEDVIIFDPKAKKEYEVDDKEANMTIPRILTAIDRGKLASVSEVCPMFLDSSGNPVRGISINDAGELLIANSSRPEDVVLLDIRKCSDTYIKQTYMNARLGGRSNYRRIFSKAWASFNNLNKVIWDKRIDLTDSLFSSCPAEDYENIFASKKTSLPSNLFKSSRIKKIIIPQFVTSIGTQCFAFCKNLQSIYIPKGCFLNENVFDTSGLRVTTVYYEGGPHDNCLTAKRWGKSKIYKLVTDCNEDDIKGLVKYVKLTPDTGTTDESLTEGLIDKATGEYDSENVVTLYTYKLPKKTNSLGLSIYTSLSMDYLKVLCKEFLDIVSRGSSKEEKDESYSKIVNRIDSQSGDWNSNIKNYPDYGYLLNQIVCDWIDNKLYLVYFDDNDYYHNEFRVVELWPGNGQLVWHFVDFLNKFYELYDFYLFQYPYLLTHVDKDPESSFNKVVNKLSIVKIYRDLTTGNTSDSKSINDYIDLIDENKSPIIVTLEYVISRIMADKDMNNNLPLRDKVLLLLKDMLNDSVDYSDILDHNYFNLANIDENKARQDLASIKLSPAVIDDLEKLGYSEQDFFDAVNNPDDNIDLYNIILNSYYITTLYNLMEDYKKTLAAKLLDKGIYYNPSFKTFTISYKAFVDNFLKQSSYDAGSFAKMNDKGGNKDSYYDNNTPKYIILNVIYDCVKDAVLGTKLKSHFWNSFFQKVFDEKLKEML